MPRGVTFTATERLVTEMCCDCSVLFAMPQYLKNEMVQSHRWFYCPNGHKQQYIGKSEAEELREKLEREQQALARERSRRDQAEADADHQRARANGYKGQLTKRSDASPTASARAATAPSPTSAPTWRPSTPTTSNPRPRDRARLASTGGATVNAGEVRDALGRRWPDSEYLRVAEAPQDAMRQGRKIDLLVVSLWKSRGYELDAVEIKVSASDWKRELDNAGKADWWWQHVHRFWVAVPVALAPKVRDELPTSWGLLACSDGHTKVVVPAPKHTPEPLPWESIIGVMRAASNAGWNALQRAEQKGYDRGAEAAKAEMERQTGDVALRGQLAELRAMVDGFTAASGVDLSKSFGRRGAERLGTIVKLVDDWLIDPVRAGADLRRNAAQVRRSADRLDELASALSEVMAAQEGAA